MQFLEDFMKKQGKNESIMSATAAKAKAFSWTCMHTIREPYMERFGLTQEHFAKIAVKSHKNGALNPHAQYQKEVTIEEVINSGDISFPLTKMMCSPICDGSAAAIICSKEKAAQFTTTRYGSRPRWWEAQSQP